MPDDVYTETVGAIPSPYDVGRAILRDCPSCGQPAGVKCCYRLNRGASATESHIRRIPCIQRLRESEKH